MNKTKVVANIHRRRYYLFWIIVPYFNLCGLVPLWLNHYAQIKIKEIPMNLEPVIGLEVHAQLKTKTKIFCACSTAFGASPNTHVCPVCLGMPGVLPVLNKKVVEYTLRMALATNCRISRQSRFARKNYFYPDLPKGYQISQYELPIAAHGFVDVEVKGSLHRIGITRIHMEVNQSAKPWYALEGRTRVARDATEIERLPGKSHRTIKLDAGTNPASKGRRF